MGRLKSFEIQFSNTLGVYHAGQELKGKLLMHVEDPKKIDKIFIEFKGKAKTHWTRHHGKSSTHYSSEEYYFNSNWDTDFMETCPNSKIPPGNHEIPFSFALPSNLPSSFEGPHGHIRYTCTARMARTWKFDITCRRAFTVIAKEDLNHCSTATDPLHVVESTSLDCCCFSRGAISISLRIPKRGFVPGEGIPMSFDITNNSSRALKNILARVKQYVIYRGQSFWGYEDTKDTSTEVARVSADCPIRAGESIKWTNERLVIPPVPPCLVGCNIIDISYVLKLDIDRHINFALPLIIGTVPLRDSTSNSDRGSAEDEHPPAFAEIYGDPPLSSLAALGDVPPPPYRCETPPPAYQECIFGSRVNIREDDDNDDNMMGELEFAPRYVYYSRETIHGSELSPLIDRSE